MKKNLPPITPNIVVFTKHAEERMVLRNLNQDMIIQVMQKPNKLHYTDDNKVKFIKKTMGANIHAVCKPIPEENKWLVISVWVRGENDKGEFVRSRSFQPKRGKPSQDGVGVIFGLIIFVLLIVYYFSTQIQ